MEPIRWYRWGLIPVDTNPETGAPIEMRPPMLTPVAMDEGSSLVLDFRTAPATARVSVQATALSAGTRGPHLFRLFTGRSLDSYRPLPQTTWKSSNEDLYTVYSTDASGLDVFLKITLDEAPTLVVNGVQCQRS